MSDATNDEAGPLAALWQRLREIVLDGAIPERPRLLSAGLASFRALVLAVLRFERDRGRERAAALAYGTLLALIRAPLHWRWMPRPGS